MFVVAVEVEHERVLEVESAEVGGRDEAEALDDRRRGLAGVILPALDEAQLEISESEAVRERADVRGRRAFPVLAGLDYLVRPPRADESKVPASLRSKLCEHGVTVDHADVERGCSESAEEVARGRVVLEAEVGHLGEVQRARVIYALALVPDPIYACNRTIIFACHTAKTIAIFCKDTDSLQPAPTTAPPRRTMSSSMKTAVSLRNGEM